MDKNYVVTKSNYFIMNSNYDLSLEEQKIILTLASMVRKDDEEFKPYKFKINSFMELVGVEDKSKYTEIPKITLKLMKKVFEIHEGKKLIQTAWLSGAVYEKGTGYVELTFSPYLKPYMLQLGEKFTQYKLANILSMKSKYSPRIYEILKCNEFKEQKYIEIEIDDLRKLLKAEKIYPMYNDFKRKIIIQTQKELKKLTDIDFEFEEIKTGRKITSLKFYIKPNKSKISIKSPSFPTTANDEVSATTTELEENPKETEIIKQVQAIFYKHEISEREAKAIFKDSKSNTDLIKQCYDYTLSKNKIDNIVGYVRTLVKEFNGPKGSIKKNTFNNFEQRTYNFDDLEKRLRGIDKEIITENEDYEQLKIQDMLKELRL